MDLTDLTISPMIPVGMGVLPVAIHKLTGWGLLASCAVGVIPGAILGFCAGVLLFWTISFVLLGIHRITSPKAPAGKKTKSE